MMTIVRPMIVRPMMVVRLSGHPLIRDSLSGVPREVAMMQAMTIKTRWAPARALSSFPLWYKGGKHRRGVPRHQEKVSEGVLD